ncbi:MAG: hypothetical protein ACLTXI_02820 [Collinsella sp.]
MALHRPYIMMGFFTRWWRHLRDSFMGVVRAFSTHQLRHRAIAGSATMCVVMSGIMSNVAALVVCVVVTMGLRWLAL